MGHRVRATGKRDRDEQELIMKKFFTSQIDHAEWVPCNAQSLSAAKAIASKRNPHISKTGICVGMAVDAPDGIGTLIEQISFFDFGGWIDEAA